VSSKIEEKRGDLSVQQASQRGGWSPLLAVRIASGLRLCIGWARMTKQRWANIRALLTAALDLTGAKVVGQRQKIELSPSWSSLWNRVGDKYARWRLSRFFTHVSAKGVEPDQVNDRTSSTTRCISDVSSGTG
jgi:hypothetical protein